MPPFISSTRAAAWCQSSSATCADRTPFAGGAGRSTGGAMRARFRPLFGHVTDWIFDLDNCLYPASTGLFELIDERMGAYIERLLGCDPVEAKRVQKSHFHTHGTTLAGLMREHGVDPHEFLEDVHAVPLDRLARDHRLARNLARLPGRKLIFTNADEPYARR